MLRTALLALSLIACTHQDDLSSQPASGTMESALDVAAPTCETADLANDAVNCGVCGNVCASGLCYAGACGDDQAGQVFVIGHSYTSSNGALDRVLGNAIGAAKDKVVDVLIYRGTSSNTIASGTTNAIARGGSLMARGTRRVFTPSTTGVMDKLPTMDVLVIAAQPQMTDAQLQNVKRDLAMTIDDFLRRGGVVIALDAPSAKNSGTAQIVSDILPVTRATSAPGATATVSNHGSMTAASVPLTFAIKDVVGYAPSGHEDAITTESGHVLVAHRAFY